MKSSRIVSFLAATGTFLCLLGCGGSHTDGPAQQVTAHEPNGTGSQAVRPAQPVTPRVPKGTLVKLHSNERTALQAVKAELTQASQGLPEGLPDRLLRGELPGAPSQSEPGTIAQWVSSHGIEYTSTDDKDQDRVFSGRVYLPTFWRSGPVQVPLVVYVHGTELDRRAVPFFNRGPEAMIGALAAYNAGMVVAMPDLPGLGLDASARPHAYCHAKTLANCVLDMIKPTLETLDPALFTWDGRIFLMGYSEGGYAALAAVREAQSNPFYFGLPLTAAACMGGPFQLSKSIRHLLADAVTPYERPYVQALLLHAYHDLYPERGLFDPVAAFNPELLVDRRTGAVDDGNLLRWLDGSLNGEQITRRIKLRLKGDAQAPLLAREVLHSQWVDTHHLADAWPETPVAKVLRENDLVGGWVPHVPILLASSPHDECVPAANSVEAKREWLRLGCEAKVHLCPLTWEGSRLNHEKGAMMGLAIALGWIRTHHWPMAGPLFESWVGPEDPLREAAWNFLAPR